MNESNRHLQGNVNLDMRVTKLENGYFKASCQGLEANSFDEQKAVLDLQLKLQDAILTGELKPGM